jgi:NAD(P)-dependent dehydrogenase (short-subunit alcohol dehydrogenase family)
MKIAGSTALVTGANRGIGRHFAQQLVERGAARVYATARNPELIGIAGVTTLALDITDPSSVAAAAAAAPDVDLLINNAGIATYTNLVTGDLEQIQREMNTHYFGTLSMVRAFAPVLSANGGGAILNMLSGLSWLSFDGSTAYCAAKSAEWGLTNGIRLELTSQGTLVTAVHVGAVDTDMSDPADVVRIALDGLEAGQREVIVDDFTAQIKSALASDPIALYPQTVGG